LARTLDLFSPSPVVQGLIGNAQICGDLALRSVTSTDQFTGFPSEFLGIDMRTTDCGLLPLGSSPE
jgi:hypothetical protein